VDGNSVSLKQVMNSAMGFAIAAKGKPSGELKRSADA
jgi:hypothetical protein